MITTKDAKDFAMENPDLVFPYLAGAGVNPKYMINTNTLYSSEQNPGITLLTDKVLSDNVV